MTIGIQTLVSHFPERVEPAGAFAQASPRAPARRHLATERDAAEQLGTAAARKVLAEAGCSAADLDLIIAHHLGGQYIMPSIGSAIHAGLAAPLELPAYGLQSAEASFIDACFLARAMIEGDAEVDRVLVVSATAMHTGGWGVDPSAPWGATWGDGAAAALIIRDGAACEILAYANETCGEIYDACVVDFSGPEQALTSTDASTTNAAMLHASPAYQHWLRGDGWHATRRALERALAGAGVEMQDVDFIVPHQLTAEIVAAWQADLEAAGVPADRWRHTFERYGNVGAADIAATMTELAGTGELRPGHLLAWLAPAVGGHCPAMIVRWRADMR